MLFKEEVKKLDQKTAASFTLMREDMQKMWCWIQYVHSKIKSSDKCINCMRRMDDLEHNITVLTDAMVRIVNQQQTLIRALQPEVRQSDKESDTGSDTGSDIAHNDCTPHARTAQPVPVGHNDVILTHGSHNLDMFGHNLARTETKLVKILVDAKKPMTYDQIAQMMELNYNTVKNIIYKVRKKGINIQAVINPEGKKEFYLNQEIKTKLSER